MSTTYSPPSLRHTGLPLSNRLVSIDALRGLVMLLMLVDHIREFFFLHAQVSDPMVVESTSPDLFFTRFVAHICAPVFVGLTGVSAFLYGESRAAKTGGDAVKIASGFLLKRGLFLIVLELTIINFAWWFTVTPKWLSLQVIWVIGLSMLVLAAAVHIPRLWLALLGGVLVLGHNMLGPISFTPDEAGYTLWAILHDRGIITLPFGIQARTSYPALPWFGVIMLGYAIGPWFKRTVDGAWRRAMLSKIGLGMIAMFLIARSINIYGEPAAWSVHPHMLTTLMSFLNLTKYPPSMDFLLLTLGIGLLLLAYLERAPQRLTSLLAVFGAVPMFFYIVHLYGLHLLNLMAQPLWGVSESGFYSFSAVWHIWLMMAVLAVPLWFACRSFGRYKRSHSQWWLAYL